jgi:U5 small nuclear ribonucleoprotein component
MMEPVYYVEIQCTADSINAIYPLIARRRGSVINESAKAGSPLHTIKCYIPVIDSLGFETDLRVHTVGQAFCLMSFDHWTMLTGDPLDKKIVLRPLEPLQPHELAR